MCYARVHLVEEIAHPVLRTIKRELPGAKRDIAVVNAGLHYGIGDPKYEEGFAFLKNFIAEHRDELPHIIWKDTSPQHFEYENGYYWCACMQTCYTFAPHQMLLINPSSCQEQLFLTAQRCAHLL